MSKIVGKATDMSDEVLSLKQSSIMHDYEVMKYCVEDYLKYIRSLDTSLKAIEADIAYQDARLNLVGASYEPHYSGTPRNDRFSEGVVKLIELRERWSEEYLRYADDREFARDLCKPSSVNRYIVWMHEVERAKWDDVAREVGYSVSQTRRIAGQGIEEIYHLMPEEWRRDPIPNAMTR